MSPPSPLPVEPIRRIAVYPGIKSVPSRIMNQLGPLAQGLVRLAQWKLPVLPAVVVLDGIPGDRSLAVLDRQLRKLAPAGPRGALWIRTDGPFASDSSLSRTRMGLSSLVLQTWTPSTLRRALRQLVSRQPRRFMSGRVAEPPPAVHFILQVQPGGKACAGDGAGVGWTRDPATGEDGWVVRYLAGASGREAMTSPESLDFSRLDASLRRQLRRAKEVLEKRTGRVQEVEFAVAGGKLFLHRMALARLSPQATAAAAVAMAKARIITRAQALAQVDPSLLSQWLLPRFDPRARNGARVLARGFPASPGAAAGKPVFCAQEALRRGGGGEAVILVQPETYAQDVAGMRVCRGVLTSSGGMTSHAAVVARGWGLCAVVGAGLIRIDARRRRLLIGDRVVTAQDMISLDGTTGEVLEGELPVTGPNLDEDVKSLLAWADQKRKLVVLANADTPQDALRAKDLGAQGIGLCRSEHMFFAPRRLALLRRILLETDSSKLEEDYPVLQAMQQEDFEAIFTAMDGLPVTIRLLDAPLHEFLPAPGDVASLRELAQALKISPGTLRRRLAGFREVNPMMGWRGCRLSLVHPRLLDVQVRAIVGAVASRRAKGAQAQAGILLPLVSMEEELTALLGRIREQIPRDLKISLGVMIETPRAALLAGRLARHVDFLSLGTNDLTQFAYGLSRDDAGLFLPAYMQQGILTCDPFVRLDADGVGELIRQAVQQARRVNPTIRIGLCGEHGGDPGSMDLVHQVGLESVSCSPLRLATARLAAARAFIAGASKPWT